MAINFPNSPQVNDTYTEGNRSWTWNGTYWRATSATIGYAGSRGYSGSIGYSGSQGDPGRSVLILGSVSSSSTLPSPYTGDIGDGYITQDTGHLWVWDGSQFYDVGRIIGYTGSVGYTGSRGALQAWTLIDADTTATNNARYLADTSNGQFTLTLPANPSIGYYVIVTDAAAWATTALLVDGNGETIEGYTDPIALDVTGITVEFIWGQGTWEVTATLGVRGDLGYTGSQGIAGTYAALGYTGSSAPLGALDQSLIPDADDTYDLGSATYKWRSLYVGANTIYLGTAAMSIDEVTGALTVTTPNGDPITVGGASVEVAETAPADPDEGNMWLDSTNGNFSVYVGGGWLKVGPGGGGSASVEVAASAPSSPDEGNMWVNSTTSELSVYVNGAWSTVGGGASVEVSTTAPGSPEEGNMWLDSDTGEFSVYVGGAWLIVGGGQGAIIESSTTAPANPTDGTLWLDTNTGIVSVYYGTAWISVSGGETDFANIAGNIAASGTVKAGNPFYLNSNTVTANFTIPAGTNAMSAGPITLADDVVITVPDGSEWTVV